MPTKGVMYVAYGDKARREAELSMSALAQHNRLECWVVGEPAAGASLISFPQRDPGGRWAKVNLYDLSPFDLTVYLDADTRPQTDISALFDILAAGFDMVICPSRNQGSDAFWHIDPGERQVTNAECYNPVQLQGGVFGFTRSDAVSEFFQIWRSEWERWHDQDQAALMRALYRHPLRLWLLGTPWNGGAVIQHLYGRARAQ